MPTSVVDRAHPQGCNGPVGSTEAPRELVFELLQLLAGISMWTASSVKLLRMAVPWQLQLNQQAGTLGLSAVCTESCAA